MHFARERILARRWNGGRGGWRHAVRGRVRRSWGRRGRAATRVIGELRLELHLGRGACARLAIRLSARPKPDHAEQGEHGNDEREYPPRRLLHLQVKSAGAAARSLSMGAFIAGQMVEAPDIGGGLSTLTYCQAQPPAYWLVCNVVYRSAACTPSVVSVQNSPITTFLSSP